MIVLNRVPDMSSCLTCPYTLCAQCALRAIVILFVLNKNTLRFRVRSMKREENEEKRGNLDFFLPRSTTNYLRNVEIRYVLAISCHHTLI